MRSTRRIPFVVALALGVVALGWVAAGCSRSAPRPDVVLVMIDTWRADYAGAYGFPGDISPHLDALAREGVVFEHAIVPSPWTKPSIASLFTGMEPAVHRVLTEAGRYRRRNVDSPQTDALPPESVTLAEVFAAHGYDTAAFVANPWVRAEHGFAQGFAVFDAEGAANDAPGTELVERALAWLRGRSVQGAPIFLYVHLMDPHGPYDATDEDLAAVAGAVPTGPTLQPAEYGKIPRYLKEPAWAKSEAAADVGTWRAQYAAGVRAADRALGVLLDGLRQRGRFDETVILVTSDHGEELFDHRGWDHGTKVFEHQVRVPLVVRLPQAQHAGRRVDAVVGLIDVMPALLEWSGTPEPGGVQGVSLQRAIDGPAEATRAIVSSAVKWRPEMRSVRSQRFKYIVRGKGATPLLFDLEHDPGEQHNLAAAQPETVRQMVNALRRHDAANTAHPGLARSEVELSDDVRERLRALGYLD